MVGGAAAGDGVTVDGDVRSARAADKGERGAVRQQRAESCVHRTHVPAAVAAQVHHGSTRLRVGSQAVGKCVGVAAKRRHSGAQDTVVGVDGRIEELRVGRVLFEGLAGALKFFALAIDSGIRCGIHHRGVDTFFAGVEKNIGLAQQRPAIGGAEEVHGGEHRDKDNGEESAKIFSTVFILSDLLCAARSRATVQQGQWQEA